MSDKIVFWINLGERYELNIDKTKKQAKQDVKTKKDIKSFIEETIEEVETTNTFFERTRDMVKHNIIQAVRQDGKPLGESSDQHAQNYEQMIKENKEALTAFKNLLEQI